MTKAKIGTMRCPPEWPTGLRRMLDLYSRRLVSASYLKLHPAVVNALHYGQEKKMNGWLRYHRHYKWVQRMR